MADLNALIAQGAQFRQAPDPFVQYGQMQQLEQGRQTNELNRMNMEKAQRDIDVTNALNKFLPSLNESNRSQLLGYGPAGQGVYKTMAEGDKERRLAEQATSQTAVNKSNVLKNVVAQTRDAVAGIDPTDAPSYMALRESVLGQYPELAPHMPNAWDANVRQRLLATAASVLEGQKPVVVGPSSSVFSGGTFNQAPAAPERPVSPPVSIVEFERAKTDPEFMKFLQARAAATRPPAQPRAEPAPRTQQITLEDGSQGIVNMDTGVITRSTVDGVPVKSRLSATAMKPLTQSQTIKLRTDVGKDYQNASTALSQIDDLLASATSVKTAPGLSAATGFTGKLPSFSEGAAAQAETRLANLRGKVTALGKATASMGGAIGSIANQEWKILSDQIAVLDEVKGKGPLLEQIALLEEQAKGASERIRDKYEKTRAEDFERFPQFRDLPAPKTPAVPGKPAAAQGTGGFKYLGKEGSK
jgi:hypothetical protein